MEHGKWYVLRDDMCLMGEYPIPDEEMRIIYHFVSTNARSLAASYPDMQAAQLAIAKMNEQLGYDKNRCIPISFPAHK